MAREPILVVDDDAASRKLVTVVLASEGYDVRTAAAAEEALSVVACLRPGLILLDLHLPGLDGFGLLKALRSDPALNEVPILAFTASASRADERVALEAGFDGYVAKPIAPRALRGLVSGHLALRGGNRPT